jgi:hypothetical protein
MIILLFYCVLCSFVCVVCYMSKTVFALAEVNDVAERKLERPATNGGKRPNPPPPRRRRRRPRRRVGRRNGKTINRVPRLPTGGVAERVCRQFIQLLEHPFDAPAIPLGDSGATSFLAAFYIKTSFQALTNPEIMCHPVIGTVNASTGLKLYTAPTAGTNWALSDIAWQNYNSVTSLAGSHRPIAMAVRMQTREPMTVVNGMVYGGLLPFATSATPFNAQNPTALHSAPNTKWTSSNTMCSSWVPIDVDDITTFHAIPFNYTNSCPYVGVTGMTNSTSVFHIEAIQLMQFAATTPNQMIFNATTPEVNYTVQEVWNCFIHRGRPRDMLDDSPFTIGNHAHTELLFSRDFREEAKSTPAGWFGGKA